MEFQELLTEFKDQLDELENGNGDILFKAESGIAQVEKYLKKHTDCRFSNRS